MNRRKSICDSDLSEQLGKLTCAEQQGLMDFLQPSSSTTPAKSTGDSHDQTRDEKAKKLSGK